MAHFVLVHGAWHGAWCWDRVLPVLRGAGHGATAVELPKHQGVTTEECADVIEHAVSMPEDTVIVAHSGAGLVAPLAAARAGVAELVLVAALMHVPGQSWVQQRMANGSEQHTDFFLQCESAIRKDDRGALYWPPTVAAQVFYNDCNEVDTRLATQRLDPQDLTIFTQRPPAIGAPLPHTRYVVCKQDRAISAGWAARTARAQYDATLEQFDASHSPFWSRPADFAALLSRGR